MRTPAADADAAGWHELVPGVNPLSSEEAARQLVSGWLDSAGDVPLVSIQAEIIRQISQNSKK